MPGKLGSNMTGGVFLLPFGEFPVFYGEPEWLSRALHNRCQISQYPECDSYTTDVRSVSTLKVTITQQISDQSVP